MATQTAEPNRLTFFEGKHGYPGVAYAKKFQHVFLNEFSL